MLVDKSFTQQWWTRVLNDEDKLKRWLQKLYLTEFDGYLDNRNANIRWNPEGNKFIERIFRTTANDEAFHSILLADLLCGRGWGVPDAMSQKSEENTSVYWTMMDEAIVDLKTCCAVFHLGEQLAAERFEVILECKSTPSDVAYFIETALPDEQYHSAAFKHIAGDEAIARVFSVHTDALEETLTRKYVETR